MVFMQGKALGQGHSQNNQPSTFGLRGLLILGMPLPWGFTMHFFVNVKQLVSEHFSAHLNTQKILFYVALLLLEYKDDLYKSRWLSYRTLNHSK